MTGSVLGLGNALLDSFVTIDDDAEIERLGLTKGGMHRIEPERADQLAENASDHQPGGSIANSLAVIASLGGDAEFIGKTGVDEAGRMFRRGMDADGVRFDTPAVEADTGRCVVLVSADGERTMATSTGCSSRFSARDIDENQFRDRAAFLFDGYLMDSWFPSVVCRLGSIAAHKHGAFVATSLADAHLVRRNLARFRKVLTESVDVVFANERELAAFSGSDDPVKGMDAFAAMPNLTVFATLGAEGALVRANGRVTHVPAAKVDRVVDTTGAGDAFAAGTIFGLIEGRSAIEAARLGGACAAHIIRQVGARPQTSLRALAA